MNSTSSRAVLAAFVLASCAGPRSDSIGDESAERPAHAAERVVHSPQQIVYVESRGGSDVFRFEACEPPALRLSRGRMVRTDTDCRGENFDVVWMGYLMWPLSVYNDPSRLIDVAHLERGDGSRCVAAIIDDGGNSVLNLWELVPSASESCGYEVRHGRHPRLRVTQHDGDTVGSMRDFEDVELVEFDGAVLLVLSGTLLGRSGHVWFVEPIANLVPGSELGVVATEPTLDSARMCAGEAASADVSVGRLYVAMRSGREHSREGHLQVAVLEDWRFLDSIVNRILELPVPEDFAIDVDVGRLSVARRTDSGVERSEYEAVGNTWKLQRVHQLPVTGSVRFWFIDRGVNAPGLWVEGDEVGQWFE